VVFRLMARVAHGVERPPGTPLRRGARRAPGRRRTT